jgi:hypothetical protein
MRLDDLRSNRLDTFTTNEHTSGRKELTTMEIKRGDSKEQAKQEQQNKQRHKTAVETDAMDPNSPEMMDKKLNGPNRPST